MLRLRLKMLPLALCALFAATTATSLVASQAAQPASAQGYPHHRAGHYRYHGRYWEHRTWHRGYWAEGHRWHPGVWVYF